MLPKLCHVCNKPFVTEVCLSISLIFTFFYSSQLSQSQVQVKLEPPEDAPILALNGDSQSDDGHYHSTLMNGNGIMETGAIEHEVRQR